MPLCHSGLHSSHLISMPPVHHSVYFSSVCADIFFFFIFKDIMLISLKLLKERDV